jgi:2-C-methyl-D-erythritol 4-phosphate cytidylyltransferase
MNTAIIVAAGSGTRFNSEKPKQFVEVSGKPLIVHTLERFEEASSIDSVILVLAEDRIPEFKTISGSFYISKLAKIVAGGATRSESVFNGLNAVADECEIVAVHDGARPLVSPEEIDLTVSTAQRTGAACLVGAVNDTIKSVRGNEIAATLDRTQLRRALTPQAFKVEVLRKAFENAELSEEVTDECYLVEKLGHPIAIVEGSSRNIKITRNEDLAVAVSLLFEK